MKMKNAVSVVIPCFNNENTILETIDSVMNQTYSNIEIIVVNDGSTDKSLELLKNIPNNKIKVLTQENQGPSPTRNKGAKLAKGDYLLFVDGDDKIAPTYIEECVNILDEDPSINIVYTKARFFEALDSEWKLPEFELSSFLTNNCIYISAMIRRNVFFDVGCFDENLRYTEDWELWIHIIKKYGGVHRVKKTLFFYRKRNDNTSLTNTFSFTEEEEKSRLYIYNKHYDFFRVHGFDIITVVNSIKYKRKYYSTWYKKIFYKYIKKDSTRIFE